MSTHRELVKCLRTCIPKTSSAENPRPFIPVNFKTNLEEVNFSGKNKFENIYFGNYFFSVNKDRNGAILRFPSFNPIRAMKPYKNATHFRFIHALTVLSSYMQTQAGEDYEPVENTSAITDIAYSELMSLSENTPEIIIPAELKDHHIPHNDSALVSCIGIEFYIREMGIDYVVERGNSLKVGKVW
jgi:hypothetical protein